MYIYTHALNTFKSKTSKQTHTHTHPHTHTHTHTLFSVVKKGGKRGLMVPMSLFGEGKSESVCCFFPKFCKKTLKKTEHADVGVLTAHGPPGKKERVYTTSYSI